MQLSRWPDVDIQFPFAKVATVFANMQFTYEDEGNRPERWSKAEDIYLHGYWRHLWNDQYLSVNVDAQNKICTFPVAPKYGITGGQPYYALNLLEEITRPGEWYLKRTTGILYFWPPESLAGNEIYVSVLGTSLVSIENVAHVKFSDITLEISRSELIRIIDGNSISIDNCILTRYLKIN